MKILLICGAGMSTSLLVEKMKKEGEKRGMKDLYIFAEAADNLEKVIDDYDVILLGPQIRYKEKYVSELAKEKNKVYRVIPPNIYGMIDGAKTLDLAIEALKNK
ncbi:PTS sugar transporter subunit IIB [Thermoanaerobacter siderophilus]|uniref:Phosphotransferase system cellobiose-specific component IIB n=1 Tax=Thermoanaerobacter siderophilus SR4 TaxID=880478 RepID=I8R1L7_9THEO|nr:PTS sugar transporter subunit IIB [Thermoanaerobacter siderophilus]EIV99264.1 phosphotransferase system cellobiose-specific component IIB [Thermoanaerobacter siderophilus SR4]